MSDALQQTPLTDRRLAHFPVTFFATVMGLAGLTIAVRHAELNLGWNHAASRVLLAATALVFVLVSIVFMAKALRYPQALREEWEHPVKLAFFPAISIGLLLIAAGLLPVWSGAAHAVWVVGMLAQGGLTLAVLSGWIGLRPFQPMHISPAWFIPAVGNVVVPIAGAPLGYEAISWLFFSGGLVFWLVLLTLVMNRLIFHDPLPGRLYPTLVILIAPPAVAFLSWLQINGGTLDAFAQFLYATALVFAALVVTQVPGLARLPFAMSWWALSFPLAALTIATFRYAELSGSDAHSWGAGALMILLILVMGGLIGRTIRAMQRDEICQPE